MKTEISVIAVCLLAVFLAKSPVFNENFVGQKNNSDAFVLLNRYQNLNKKLVEVSRLTGQDNPLKGNVLAFASAAEAANLSSEAAPDPAQSNESNIITTAGNATIVKPSYASANAGQGNIVAYKVVPGDTVETIASRFNLSTGTIAQANNLNDLTVAKIKPGQELKLPICEGVIYSIKPDDSLESLMSKYKLNEDDVDYLLDCNDAETFEDLHNLKLAVIPQNDLQIPLAPRANLVRRVKSNTSGRLALTTANTPSGFLGGAGKLLWPAPDTRIVSQGYSWRHNGLDIAEPGGRNPGSIIVATHNCFVKIAGYSPGGYGNNVLCDRGDGLQTRYLHMSQIYVQAGDIIEAGAALGRIGSTGRSTGPHLHFQVSANGRTVNPWTYLNR